MSDKVFYEKIINPFKAPLRGGSEKYEVYFQIIIEQLGNNPYPNFSISGVHAPLPLGDCLGDCGQIVDNFNPFNVVYNKGWSVNLYKKLIALWQTFQLRDVEVGSALYNLLIGECKQFPETTKQPAWI